MGGKKNPRFVVKVVSTYSDGHQRSRSYLSRKAAGARAEFEVQCGAVSIAWYVGAITYADEPFHVSPVTYEGGA